MAHARVTAGSAAVGVPLNPEAQGTGADRCAAGEAAIPLKERPGVEQRGLSVGGPGQLGEVQVVLRRELRLAEGTPMPDLGGPDVEAVVVPPPPAALRRARDLGSY